MARYWIVERRRVKDGVAVPLRIGWAGPTYAVKPSDITRFADESSARQMARWAEGSLDRTIPGTEFEQDCRVVAVG